ncbi:hypothetical protein HPB50_011750 [Hyalomma asiaticum]|uniref:Uncharacterized protein n=1 Tax=Hyalomma asiaticum TaxID=266040 RepID=A0ACB7RSJ0_HYAAI|nr:hypothetical protein HPB50_011750 [Hyalomma asiaticum]
MERLRSKRTSRRSMNTRLINEARALLSDEAATVDQLNTIYGRLKVNNDELNKINDELESHIAVDECGEAQNTVVEHDDNATSVMTRTASWYVRAEACPEDGLRLCGWCEPSPGHAKRICKILASEWWRQARLYDECLRTQWSVVAGSRKTPTYREWCATRIWITEFLWNTVRPTLPKKKKKAQGPSTKVLSLEDTVLPAAHLKTLGLGPKFCFEPTLGPPDILAVARSVTERVLEEERGRCVAEGAGVVNELKERRGGRSKVRSLVDFLTSSSIRCLVADKEGGFVVLHESTYTEKGMIAVAKNLKKVTENPRDVRKKAIALLEKLNLDKLCTAVRGEVENLFGFVKPSLGHAKRVSKIVRAEVWRQVRLLYDWLHLRCFCEDSGESAHKEFLMFKRLAAQTTEYQWQRCLLLLPRRKKKPFLAGGFQVLDDAQVPAEVSAVLKNGPKYSVQPTIPAHELLS